MEENGHELMSSCQLLWLSTGGQIGCPHIFISWSLCPFQFLSDWSCREPPAPKLVYLRRCLENAWSPQGNRDTIFPAISPRLYRPIPRSSTLEVPQPLPIDLETWEFVHLLSQWHPSLFQGSRDPLPYPSALSHNKNGNIPTLRLSSTFSPP